MVRPTPDPRLGVYISFGAKMWENKEKNGKEEEDEKNPKPSLTQIEEIVLVLRQRMSEKMVMEMIAGQDNVQPVPGPGCPKCGAEMRYKGQKENRVESLGGGVEARARTLLLREV